MILEVSEVMTNMDSLRSNMINLCVNFMHEAQIIMLILAK